MITSLMEMLELPNFGQRTYLQYNLSHVIAYCWWLHEKNVLRKPRVANFTDIIKVVTIFIETTFTQKS